MKKLSTIITALVLSFTMAAQSSAQLVVNSCKSNTRESPRALAVKGTKENEQTVTIAEKGGYIFGIKVDEKDQLKGVKIGLVKQPGDKAQYELPVTDKLEVEFKDIKPGTYRIAFIRKAAGPKK